MAERLVLHPPAHCVEASVGDAHDVERVGDSGGVIEVRRQPRSERLGQIGRNNFDALQPVRVGVGGAFAQVNSCVALDHVDHPTRFEVDEAGCVDRVMVPVRSQERRLIHPQLADVADPVRVVDERSAVLDKLRS